MNGWIVLLRHQGADFPVALCRKQKEALKIAADRSWKLTDKERRIINDNSMDSDPCNISIVKIEKGRLAAWHQVRSYLYG